jgi:hypothetical protein
VKPVAFVALLVATPALSQPTQPVPIASTPVADVLATAPHITLRSGALTARIAPPDLQRSFYHGTRFDQAGVVTSLKLAGQEFYGPWWDAVAPDVLDYAYDASGAVGAGPDSAASGPVEEFAPLGFEARPGLFVKIGVGVLRQPDTKDYDHYRHYEIVDGGQRTTRVTASSVTFTQKLSGAGYGYTYEKTLRLSGNRMTIAHVLTNTGRAAIHTTVYDHNFLRLAPDDDGIQVTFPFAVMAATPPPVDLIRLDGDTLTYLRPIRPRERVSFPVTGYGATTGDYDIRIADLKTHAGMEIVGDQPIVKINIFSIDKVQAVEPYIAIDLPPGAQKRWRYTYSYTPPQ